MHSVDLDGHLSELCLIFFCCAFVPGVAGVVV